jgi:hypothetical protein
MAYFVVPRYSPKANPASFVERRCIDGSPQQRSQTDPRPKRARTRDFMHAVLTSPGRAQQAKWLRRSPNSKRLCVRRPKVGKRMRYDRKCDEHITSKVFWFPAGPVVTRLEGITKSRTSFLSGGTEHTEICWKASQRRMASYRLSEKRPYARVRSVHARHWFTDALRVVARCCRLQRLYPLQLQ